MEENYLISIKKQFSFYKLLGEKTFAQLNEEYLFWQFNSSTNSIAVIVNHLQGNMLSRWTDFLNTDGEKDWRIRDSEFEDVIKTKAELLNKWEAGWKCLFEAINTITKENFNRVIYIRNEGHTIIDALNRQLAHYSYHVGQIVFIGIMIKNTKWKSLSIPKGESESFNKEKFSKGKH